jgi:hypothetical protein
MLGKFDQDEAPNVIDSIWAFKLKRFPDGMVKKSKVRFRKKGKVLKLKKTLYGLRQSPHAFWQCLTKAMEAVGMKVSKLDPCLFVGDRVMAVAYVDDIYCFGQLTRLILTSSVQSCASKVYFWNRRMMQPDFLASKWQRRKTVTSK